MRRPRPAAALLTLGLLALVCCAPAARAAVYEVGDGLPYASIGSVPLEALAPGDTVLIHWRPTPYREKWVIVGPGTSAAPVTFRGVPGPGGELPVIDGENAVTRLALDYWNENRSVIKVGGSSVPANDLPTYIVIENLDVRGARPPNTFIDDGGQTRTYEDNAAALHVERGRHIIIRGCILRDSGNGLFVSSSEAEAAQDILIDGCYIHDNGNVGSIYEHNTYTAAIGIVYQFNRFGPLQPGASGNNLKDRSAGLVVRYNWIESGNRQLDLVDAEDSGLIRNHPDYPRTFVYGNILIEPDGAGNRQIAHYGGDSGATGIYRKGTLYFYHNTVVSTRSGRTTLFRLSTMDEHCDARNNIFYATAGGSELGVLDADGVLDLSHNWINAGWQWYFGSYNGVVNDDGTCITGLAPGFVAAATQDFRPAEGSPCICRAGPLHALVPPAYAVMWQYVPHAGGEARPEHHHVSDWGAFESPYRTLFDFDGDSETDADDFAALTDCLGGPDATGGTPTCLAFGDADDDGDVDLADYAALQAAAF